MNMNLSWYSLRLHFHIKVSVSCIALLCVHKQIGVGGGMGIDPSLCPNQSVSGASIGGIGHR